MPTSADGSAGVTPSVSTNATLLQASITVPAVAKSSFDPSSRKSQGSRAGASLALVSDYERTMLAVFPAKSYVSVIGAASVGFVKINTLLP